MLVSAIQQCKSTIIVYIYTYKHTHTHTHTHTHIFFFHIPLVKTVILINTFEGLLELAYQTDIIRVLVILSSLPHGQDSSGLFKEVLYQMSNFMHFPECISK